VRLEGHAFDLVGDEVCEGFWWSVQSLRPRSFYQALDSYQVKRLRIKRDGEPWSGG